jgi:hypothetical protein
LPVLPSYSNVFVASVLLDRGLSTTRDRPHGAARPRFASNDQRYLRGDEVPVLERLNIRHLIDNAQK